MNTPCNEAGTAVMTKHHNMDNAINEVDRIYYRLNELYNKITNNIPEPEKTKEEPPSQISLKLILSEGPDRIRNSCDDAHDLINQIEHILIDP